MPAGSPPSTRTRAPRRRSTRWAPRNPYLEPESSLSDLGVRPGRACAGARHPAHSISIVSPSGIRSWSYGPFGRRMSDPKYIFLVSGQPHTISDNTFANVAWLRVRELVDLFNKGLAKAG